MARFAVKSPEQQAHSVEKALQKSNEIASTRTLLNYTERLEQVAKNMPEFSIKGALLIKCSSLTNSLNLLIFRQTKGVDLI